MDSSKDVTLADPSVKYGVNNGAFEGSELSIPGKNKPDGVAVSQEDLIAQDIAEKELDEDNLPCKWGPFKLSCCQILRNPKAVVFLLCCASCVQGMCVNGFVSVIVSSLEKRFDLKSADAGLIASSYDIASLLALIPVTYFGGLGSKPRWLGFGIMFMGLGSFVFSIPHYATDLYQYDSTQDGDVCVLNSTNATSPFTCEPQSNLWRYKYVLILGQLMHGVGAAPLYTLGVTYIDENLKQKMSSVYLGFFYAMSIAGPALGYVIGGYLLSFYTDFDKVGAELITITEDSVSWVGAWWLGFLLTGGLAIIIGFIFLGFPKSLPNTTKLRSERVSEAYGGAESITTTETGLSSLRDFPKYLKVLLLNPTFIFLNLAGSSEALVVSGFTTFIPKYLESQFSISSSMAALIMGAATVPAGGGGTFLGGYFVKKFKLTVPGMLRMAVVTCLVVVVFSLVFLVKCQDVTFAGVTATYENVSGIPVGNQLSDTCNSDCHCPLNQYNPVCGANKVMYFSSCAAGCINSTEVDGVTTFSNCSCIGKNVMASVNPDLLTSATLGKCEADCNYLPLFMVLFVFIITFTMMTLMPGLSATLRCVPDKQRSFALGIQWIFIRTLGSIPGPIAFGAVIDLTCVFWLNTDCSNADNEGSDNQGACYFYNNTTLSNYMLALGMGFKALSAVFYSLALITYKAPPDKTVENNSLPATASGDSYNIGDNNNQNGDAGINRSELDKTGSPKSNSGVFASVLDGRKESDSGGTVGNDNLGVDVSDVGLNGTYLNKVV